MRQYSPSPPLVRVHTPEQAAAALAAAAAAGQRLRLLSAAGAPAFQGYRWLRAVAEAARPGAGSQVVLDCADAPGHALACLEDGAAAVAVAGLDAAVVERLRGLAERRGAEVLVAPVADLDLLDHPDPLAACRALLDRRTADER
jgi:hypothetical protein